MTVNNLYIMGKLFGITLMLIMTCGNVKAQSGITTTITGKVIDNSTKTPIDYATVSVIQQPSGKLITGALTGSDGGFRIINIPPGTYKVEINHISYHKASSDSITIDEKHPVASVGNIYLLPAMLNLEGVTIVSDKPVIENKPGKIVYNVTSDITSQGGLAIDVLKKVPQVTVDIDGNVELQGNPNIRFLIDGKPSSAFGNNLADALSSIPASQIKSIEAITNPGAKYDSQGTGGIINIILVENKMKGLSGNVNLSAGTRLENGSANFSIKHNNFGVNAYFSGNWRVRSGGAFSLTRNSTDSISGVITDLLQDGVNYSDRLGFRSGAGFEWDISKSDNLTGSFGYNRFGFSSSGLINQEELIKDLSGNTESETFTERNSISSRNISSMDWSLDYRRKFKKEGHQLDILFNSGNGRPKSSYRQTESYKGEPAPYKGSASDNPGTDNQIDISVDYTYPVNEDFRIETGLKSIIQNLTSIADTRVYHPSDNTYKGDPLQSYYLKYNMKIYAGYFATGFRLFNYLDLNPGIRYEYTDVNIDFPGTSVPSYGTLVPSITLTRNFENKNSIELAYNKRIERPSYRRLNPFIDRSDPFNISMGNIYLKPEIGDNISLSFNAGFKKGGSLRLTLRENMNTREIEDVTTFYPLYTIGDSVYKNVSVRTSENIGQEYNSGISAFVSYPVTPKLNLRTNLMLFHRYIVSNMNDRESVSGFNARVNMNLTYQLPKDLVIELFGFYRSPGRNLQGRSPQFFIYNFAFRKRFWDQNGSFGFTATNPFSRSIRLTRTTTTENSLSTNIRELPFRSFGISFTWKFGKLESGNKNKENNAEPSMPEGGAN